MSTIKDQTASCTRSPAHHRGGCSMSNPRLCEARNTVLVARGSEQDTRFVVKTLRRRLPFRGQKETMTEAAIPRGDAMSPSDPGTSRR